MERVIMPAVKELARAYLEDPSDANEAKVITKVNEELIRLGGDPLPEGTIIKEGCVEHDLIHFCSVVGEDIDVVWHEYDPSTDYFIRC